MYKMKIASILAVIFIGMSSVSIAAKKEGDFYQIKIYHLKNDNQVSQVDAYLQDAYLPALHRKGIKNIGVFKPIANDTASVKLIYVLIPFKSVEQWSGMEDELIKDKTYSDAAGSFLNAPSDKAPYDRMESILLEAFPVQDHLLIPPTKNPERVFELRSYESPTQELAEKKMAMFNSEEEVEIFKRLGFNPVFYGKVVSGSHMPNLMYMPVFDNVQKRNEGWKTFGSDAKWKEVSAKPEHENKVSVSHIDSILMHSTSYSDY
jgi:hypothetical protein